MLDKRIVIELIKCIEKIQFTEQIEGDAVIGYINDNGRVIQVSFLADNLGQYLQLSYPIKPTKDNINHSLPLIDEAFMSKQITHALSEIWDMNNVVNSTCK